MFFNYYQNFKNFARNNITRIHISNFRVENSNLGQFRKIMGKFLKYLVKELLNDLFINFALNFMQN